MRSAAILLLLVSASALGGCGLSMSNQKRYDTFEASEFWPDGAAARPLPQGAVATNHVPTTPPEITSTVLARGREEYGIFCSPCHGLAGDGDGRVVQRGFPTPPSYHSDRLRQAPAQSFFDTITNGYGVMYSFASRVSPEDRWAIVAYIRALQISRKVQLADMPDARDKLP